MRVLGFFILFVGLTGLAAAAPSEAAPAPETTELADILDDLKDVESEMAANQERIESLKARIAELQSLGKDAALEIAHLEALVQEHAARVEQLAERYSSVLALAQSLKKDLEFSNTLTYVLGTIALVATVVALAEGVVLASR